MAGTTYSKFFWADWLSDPCLRACSALARSLWMDMLCLAAQAQKHGYVMVGPAAATPADLSKISGETIPVVEALIQELESRDVFSRDRSGTIYSRRMLRDSRRRAASSKGGKIGGAVTAEKQKGIFATQGTALDSTTTNHNNQSPLAISHQPQQEPLSADERLNRIQKLARAFGSNIESHKGAPNFMLNVVKLESQGIDFDKDLIPSIRQWVSEGHIADEFGSLLYFSGIAQKFREGRLFREGAAGANVRAALSREDWIRGFEKFLDRGYWQIEFGPFPTEAIPDAPADILERAQAAWDAQGQKPKNLDTVLWPHRKPVPFFGSNIVTLQARQA